MLKDKPNSDFKKSIINLVNCYNKKDDNCSIIIVGSNYKVDDFNKINKEYSDLDVIVLTNHNSFSITTFYNNISIDISYVNTTKVSDLLITALNKKQFSSKIFSALSTNYTIIRKDKRTSDFINSIKLLHTLFLQSTLPNYALTHMYIHNINACLNDLNKRNNLKKLFAAHSLYNQIFEYVTSLIYPFCANSSFRGEIFNNYLDEINKDVNFDTNGFPIIEYSIVKKLQKTFVPVTKSAYVALYCDELVFSKLNNFNKYHFGCDNLDNEKLIVFVERNNLEKTKKEFIIHRELLLTNIIPCFSRNELNFVTDFLCLLSNEYLAANFNKRNNLFCTIINTFFKDDLHIIITKSLKAALIKKTISELYKEGQEINLYYLNSFFLSDEIPLNYEKSNVLNYEKKLTQIILFINDSNSLKEKEIKASYAFWGIMKALRINISQLTFKN